MSRVWEGRLAAAAFRLAVASPLVTSVFRRLDRLAVLTPADVDAWQNDRLSRAMATAKRRVPAYAHATAELTSLPILTKDDVRRDREMFRDTRVPSRQVTTGGTGGRPLIVNIALSSFLSEWAHIAYAWRAAGVGLTDRKLTFRGSSLGRGFSQQPIFFQPTYNHFVVSPFHLTDATFRVLLEQLGDFQPAAIWGYPSAVTPFARWVERTGPHPQLRSVRAVLLASEGAFDWQVQLFRSVFDARVVQWYGQTEKVAFAAGCPSSPEYHVLPTYGLLEVIEDRIIGSGFTNPAMPLLRYDTEDVGRWGSGECPCGLSFPKLADIKGRWDQSYLWGRGDEPISTSALNFHDPVFMNFDRFQFRQDEPGRALLRVTSDNTASTTSTLLEQARSTLQRRVGDRLVIEVCAVEADELLSRRGKMLTIDQRYSPHDDDV